MSQSKVIIGEAYWGEDKKTSGGQLGDQMVTRRNHPYTETQTATWEPRADKWSGLIRCDDTSIAQKATNVMIKLIKSGKVGYDQGNRWSLYYELEKYGWSVDKYIANGNPAETDCSAFVYTSYCCFVEYLRKWMVEKNSMAENNSPERDRRKKSNPPNTRNIEEAFLKYGFIPRGYLVNDDPNNISNFRQIFRVINDSEYINSDEHLQIGDMLNKYAKHVVMVVSLDGSIPIIDKPTEEHTIESSVYSPRRSDYSSSSSLSRSIAGAGGEPTNTGEGFLHLGTTYYRR